MRTPMRLDDLAARSDLAAKARRRKRLCQAAGFIAAFVALAVPLTLCVTSWVVPEAFPPVPMVLPEPITEIIRTSPDVLARLMSSLTWAAFGGMFGMAALFVGEQFAARFEAFNLEADDGIAVFPAEGAGVRMAALERAEWRAKLKWGLVVESADDAKRFGATRVYRPMVMSAHDRDLVRNANLILRSRQ